MSLWKLVPGVYLAPTYIFLFKRRQRVKPNIYKNVPIVASIFLIDSCDKSSLTTSSSVFSVLTSRKVEEPVFCHTSVEIALPSNENPSGCPLTRIRVVSSSSSSNYGLRHSHERKSIFFLNRWRPEKGGRQDARELEIHLRHAINKTENVSKILLMMIVAFTTVV